MSVRSTVLILVAFAAATGAVWYGPVALDRAGLGEFVFVGQVCLAILALSFLEVLFRRLSP